MPDIVENTGDSVDKSVILWISRWIGCALLVREGARMPENRCCSPSTREALHRLSVRLLRALESYSPLFPLFHTPYYDGDLFFHSKKRERFRRSLTTGAAVLRIDSRLTLSYT